MQDMTSNHDKILCLECNQYFHVITENHLNKKHGMDRWHYCHKHRIPLNTPLAGSQYRAKRQAIAEEMITEGKFVPGFTREEAQRGTKASNICCRTRIRSKSKISRYDEESYYWVLKMLSEGLSFRQIKTIHGQGYPDRWRVMRKAQQDQAYGQAYLEARKKGHEWQTAFNKTRHEPPNPTESKELTPGTEGA